MEATIMTKANIVDYVVENCSLKKKDAEAAVNAVFAAISDALAEGNKVQIASFGSFEVKAKAERKGCNPLTKEEIIIPACKAPSFKAGKALKEAVNK
jgi:DNA-binding protein HU-beta